MSAFIDTNVLVRHLTGDPPAMADRATAFLRSERDLLLTDLVAAERSTYWSRSTKLHATKSQPRSVR